MEDNIDCQSEKNLGNNRSIWPLLGQERRRKIIFT
jgi:hypothetical protein